MEVNCVSRELKGDNGQIVGSEDYFKKLNDKSKLRPYLRNRDSFDYYEDLRYTAGKISALGKPPYSRTGRADKGTATEIVVNALEYIADEIIHDLEHGKKRNDYITDSNSKNLLKAIEQLEKCGVSCKNSKKLTK